MKDFLENIWFGIQVIINAIAGLALGGLFVLLISRLAKWNLTITSILLLLILAYVIGKISGLNDDDD